MPGGVGGLLSDGESYPDWVAGGNISIMSSSARSRAAPWDYLTFRYGALATAFLNSFITASSLIFARLNTIELAHTF